MKNSPIRTRIAPSPTGQLHIGSLATALRNYAYAKKNNGQFIIRIEDTDRERLVPGALEATLEVLHDYGLTWDEGPDINGPFGPYIQSQRLELYHQHVQALIQKDKAYYCFCTIERLEKMRADQQAQKRVPHYDRHCLNLPPSEVEAKLKAHEPYVVRLKVPDQQKISFTDLIRGDISFQSDGIDDQVLLKSDSFPTYHLAVVIDDHLMNISHIIRGEEWISSTPKHILLYQAFDWEIPIYAHAPVFLSPTGKGKMSKRHGDVDARSFLNKGYLPEAVLNFLMIMGWAPKDKQEFMTLERFVQEFDIQDISAKAVIFDTHKLDWLNGLWIRSLSHEELIARLKPFIPPGLDTITLAEFLPLIKERLITLQDIKPATDYLISPPSIEPNALLKISKMEASDLVQYLDLAAQTLKDLSAWDVASIETSLRNLQASQNVKPRPAFMTLRLTLTGQEATPPLFDLIKIIGQKEVVNRLRQASKLLSET